MSTYRESTEHMLTVVALHTAPGQPFPTDLRAAHDAVCNMCRTHNSTSPALLRARAERRDRDYAGLC